MQCIISNLPIVESTLEFCSKILFSEYKNYIGSTILSYDYSKETINPSLLPKAASLDIEYSEYLWFYKKAFYSIKNDIVVLDEFSVNMEDNTSEDVKKVVSFLSLYSKELRDANRIPASFSWSSYYFMGLGKVYSECKKQNKTYKMINSLYQKE